LFGVVIGFVGSLLVRQFLPSALRIIEKMTAGQSARLSSVPVTVTASQRATAIFQYNGIVAKRSISSSRIGFAWVLVSLSEQSDN
jgi:hypothetical protein